MILDNQLGIGRYFVSATIAEYRIEEYDGGNITFGYNCIRIT